MLLLRHEYTILRRTVGGNQGQATKCLRDGVGVVKANSRNIRRLKLSGFFSLSLSRSDLMAHGNGNEDKRRNCFRGR